MRWIVAAMLAGAALAAPVVAQDANGFHAIASGDLKLAEEELLRQRQDFPARPELMLNLAHVYVKTNRAEQARALYQDVLTRRDVAMDLSSGSVVTSHALAQLGLARLKNATLAAR